MASPRTWSTAGWHDRRESRTRGPDDEIDAGIVDYEEETMHDSGEHDTLDDQIAYEAEHGTREYRLACELAEILDRESILSLRSPGGMEGTLLHNTLHRARDMAAEIADFLAPRPTITPAGSIEDVEWRDQ